MSPTKYLLTGDEMSAQIGEVEKLSKELITYIPNAQKAKSQPAKEILFASFAERVLGVRPEEFSEKMETPVASKLWLVKGRVDAVFGNLLIEFKVDLDKELDDAKDELKKYFQSFKEKFPSTHYVGIATDGTRFRVFKPVFNAKGAVQSIEQIDSLDLEKEQSHPEKIFLWFDSYLYVSEKIVPTTDDHRRRFGVESPTFAFMLDEEVAKEIESHFRELVEDAAKSGKPIPKQSNVYEGIVKKGWESVKRSRK